MNLFKVHGKWGETFISNDNFWLEEINKISYFLPFDCFGYGAAAPWLRDHYEFILQITNVRLVLWLKWGADFLDPSGFQVSAGMACTHNPFLLFQLWTLKGTLTYTALCLQVPAVLNFASYTGRVSLDLCHIWLLFLSRHVGDYLCFKKVLLNLSVVFLFYDVIAVNI